MHARARTHTHAQFWSTRMPIPNLHFGQFDKNDSVRVIQIQSLVMFIGSIQVITFMHLRKRGSISLSRSVMNEIVNVLLKYCCGVAAGVFARFSCRHSWNLRLRRTEPGNDRPADTIQVLRHKLSMLSWHSSIATSVMAVRMSMQRPCKLILSGRT